MEPILFLIFIHYFLINQFRKGARVKVERTTVSAILRQKTIDFKLLVKLRLSMTVVFSSVMAYLIAVPVINFSDVLILAIGGFLVTGAANALNQVLEKDYDKLMTRTANRPIAAGRMSVSDGVVAAGFMSTVGITFLAYLNPWAAFFGTLSMMFYAFLYTPLKRTTSAAVFVGAVSGAMPVLIGCVVAEGTITELALLLFSIQFFWQYPHFWSIAWLGFEDYQKAGYQFIPASNNMPDKSIGKQSFLYSIFLIAVIGMAFGWNMITVVPSVLILVFSMFFSYMAFQFYKQPEKKTALRLMLLSLGYIPFVLMMFLLNKTLF